MQRQLRWDDIDRHSSSVTEPPLLILRNLHDNPRLASLLYYISLGHLSQVSLSFINITLHVHRPNILFFIYI